MDCLNTRYNLCIIPAFYVYGHRHKSRISFITCCTLSVCEQLWQVNCGIISFYQTVLVLVVHIPLDMVWGILLPVFGMYLPKAEETATRTMNKVKAAFIILPAFWIAHERKIRQTGLFKDCNQRVSCVCPCAENVDVSLYSLTLEQTIQTCGTISWICSSSLNNILHYFNNYLCSFYHGLQKCIDTTPSYKWMVRGASRNCEAPNWKVPGGPKTH